MSEWNTSMGSAHFEEEWALEMANVRAAVSAAAEALLAVPVAYTASGAMACDPDNSPKEERAARQNLALEYLLNGNKAKILAIRWCDNPRTEPGHATIPPTPEGWALCRVRRFGNGYWHALLVAPFWGKDGKETPLPEWYVDRLPAICHIMRAVEFLW